MLWDYMRRCGLNLVCLSRLGMWLVWLPSMLVFVVNMRRA